MGAIVVAALTGLFAGGPLSRAEATDPSGALTIRYERLLRQGSRWTMELRLAPSGGETAALWIGQDLLAASHVRRMVPEPAESRAGAGGTQFRFRTGQRDRPVTIRIHFEADAIGLVRARVGVPDRAPLVLLQFVYP